MGTGTDQVILSSQYQEELCLEHMLPSPHQWLPSKENNHEITQEHTKDWAFPEYGEPNSLWFFWHERVYFESKVNEGKHNRKES